MVGTSATGGTLKGYTGGDAPAAVSGLLGACRASLFNVFQNLMKCTSLEVHLLASLVAGAVTCTFRALKLDSS